MKVKDLIYLLGFKPKPKEYSYDIDTVNLSDYGEINFARWKHPKERYKKFCAAQVDALKSFLKEGDVAIDIGSHTGDTTIPMALAVGQKGKIFALEPNIYVHKILLANVALNVTKTNIVPLMFAATEKDDNYIFNYSDNGFCNGGYLENISKTKRAHFFSLEVMGKNLNTYLKNNFPDDYKKIKYIKIDTEGFDMQVASTLEELIKRNKPYILSEIYLHTTFEDRKKYYGLLTDWGYKIFKFDSDIHYTGQELLPDDLNKWNHYDIFCVHGSAA